MEAIWHRYNSTVFGRTQDADTVTMFFDYDLLNWTFGIRGERDDCWLSIHFQFGPIAIEFCKWRSTSR